ncbi:MAG: hypothetical protein JO207_08530 [Verrucomicrobia bacterium]|nr:hypothetical protein [Verrucomicrobiota bacterium]
MHFNPCPARSLSLILISAVCFLNHAQAQTLTNIYLAARTDGIAGTGTASDPFNASTPDRYDQLLATYSQNTVFNYAPGTYQTRGWRFRTRKSAGTNCKHYGAGVDQTVIQLVGANDLTQDGVIFGSDYDATADGFELHDLTLDCNASGNPKFTNHLGAVTAIATVGSNMLFRGIKVIGFGTGRVGAECFAVLISPGPALSSRSFDNITIDSCVFTNPAQGNQDGLTCVTIGTTAGVTLTNASVINSWFIDLASDFSFSSAFFAEQCIGNYVQNCDVGSYTEPLSFQPNRWLVQNNTFNSVYCGALVKFHATGKLQDLEFIDNTVVLRNSFARATQAVAVAEPIESVAGLSNKPEVVNIAIQGNSVQAASVTPQSNDEYAGFVIISQTQKYFVDTLTITGNRFSGANTNNGRQIAITNAPNFVTNSQISGNYYDDGTAVIVDSVPPWQ